MIQLIYVSQHKSLSFQEAQQILNNSFAKNKTLDMGGVLIYAEGHFIQCLEGDDTLIEETFKKIKKDTRHENIVEIAKDKIEQRSFDGWNMSLVNERGFNSIVKKYCDNETFNPYFMSKETILTLLQEITKVM